jgi:hypothetical protein
MNAHKLPGRFTDECAQSGMNAAPVGTPARVPKGHFENSPTLQRWVLHQRHRCPEGTVDWIEEDEFELSRPFGTWLLNTAFPTLKHWAIFGCPFGTAIRESVVEFPKRMRLSPLTRFGFYAHACRARFFSIIEP